MKDDTGPAHVTTGGLGAGRSPRERAVAHLETLLRGAAALGTGALLAWSSRADAQQPPQVCDPLPPPVNCKAPETFRLENCVAQHTRWTKAGDRWTLDFTLWTLSLGSRGDSLPAMSPPTRPDASSAPNPDRVTFAGVRKEAVAVTGGALSALTISGGRLDLTLIPAPASREIRVTLPNPTNQTAQFSVLLDLAEPPVEGGAVAVRLVAPMAR